MHSSTSRWRLCSYTVSLFMFSLLAAGQQTTRPVPPTDMSGLPNQELASLRSGSLTVWESGSGVWLGWATIQNALKADFPDLQINFRVIEPEQFIATVAAAKQVRTLPDVVFVENWRQVVPLIAQQKVVEMTGNARFMANGWWFQLIEAAHPDTAQAFLRWLEDSPHWQPPRFSTVGMTPLDNAQVTSAALLAVAGMAGGGAMDPVMDPDALKLFALNWGSDCGPISGISFPVPRFVFGNGRLAYAAVAAEARSGGGSVPCNGVMYSFLVLRKRYDGWKVLLVMPHETLDQAVGFARQFDQLHLTTSEGPGPAVPDLLSPFDGEHQTRFPKEYVSWRQDALRPVAYAVESTFGLPSGGPATYRTSRIAIYPAIDYGDTVRIPEPFGAGMQPHRWRIWAIGQDGQVAISEWRTVNFTN